MNVKNRPSRSRPYQQRARAKAATETGERIMEAFEGLLQISWFDEIRLEDVAAQSQVTVQTVIRRFGGKEGLLDASNERLDRVIRTHRQMPIGNVPGIIAVIIDGYEVRGDYVLRLLAQEDRYPQIKVLTDHGRKVHRAWTSEVFSPWLSNFTKVERRNVLDHLVLALDVYVWKLIRKDMKRSKAALARTMLDLCAHALGVSTQELVQYSMTRSETGDA